MGQKSAKEKFPNGSIMIVDGSDTDKEAIAAPFAEKGYEAIVCKDPQRVFRVLDIRPKSWKPILISVDMIVPGHSGFEIMRQLAKKFPNKEVPLLMTSRHPTGEDLLEATNAGAHDLKQAPLTLEMLDEILEKIEVAKLKAEVGDMVFKIDYT